MPDSSQHNDRPAGAQPAAASPNLSGAHVLLLDPQGQPGRTITLTAQGLTIGRLPSSDLVLDAPTVSRNHARIDWDGRQAHVTDLGARSGTQLGAIRLVPQQAQVWQPDQVLQVGPYSLRLQSGPVPPAISATTPISQSPRTQMPNPLAGVAMTMTMAPINQLSVALALGQEYLELTPGQPMVVSVTVSTDGEADTILLSVDGLPDEWLVAPPAPLTLPAGASAVATLTINVPELPESQAGEYAVTVRAQSVANPAQVALAHGRWLVLPFTASQIELMPRRARGQEQALYAVHVHNQGNAPAAYNLRAEDDEQALAFGFAQSDVEVEPGQTLEVPLTAQAARRLYGRPRRYNFLVHATNEMTAQTAEGQFVHEAVLPFWSLPAAIGLVLLVFLCGLLPRPAEGNALAVLPFGFLNPKTPTPLVTAVAVDGSGGTAAAIQLITQAALQAAVGNAVNAQPATKTFVAGLVAASTASAQAATAAASQTAAANATASAVAAQTATALAQAAAAGDPAAIQTATAAAQQTAAAVAQQTAAAPQTVVALQTAAAQQTVAGQRTATAVVQQTAIANGTVIPTAIGNSPPQATVSLSPEDPKKPDTIDAQVSATDANGDTVLLTYVWKRNGFDVIDQTAESYTGEKIKGDTISVEVTPNDGIVDGGVATASVTIVNSLPTVTLTLAPNAPIKTDTITAQPNPTDVDGDLVTLAYVWKRNGTVVTGQTSATYTGPQAKDDSILVEVTPNDKTDNGTVATASVKIVNSPPSATVSLTPNAPTKTSTITAQTSTADIDGDPVALTYVWKRNGTVVNGQSSATYSGGQAKNDTIIVEVTPNDGKANGTVATASVAIGNLPPSVTVTLAPGSPTKTSSITATPGTPTDPDNDPVTLTYTWTRNGTVVANQSAATYTGSQAKGDAIAVTVTPNDGTVNGTTGTASVTIGNLPPSVSVSLAPGSPTKGSSITAQASPTDPDAGDTVTLTYVWKLNGTVVANQSAATYTGGQAKGNSISVEVTPNDGTANGAVATDSVTIGNSPPSVSVNLTPNTPTKNDTTITAQPTATDPDGDPVTLIYVWKRNGTPVAGQTSATYTGGQAKGQTITVEVTPSDGTANGTVATDSVTVGNLPPSVTVSLSSNNPKTTDNLTAQATPTDPDGDAVTLKYVWKRNGTVVSGQTSATYTGQKVHKDIILVEVTPNDGTTDGTADTDSVTVANSLPTVTSIALAPTSPKATDVITATPTGTDPDGETVTFKYRWKHNGTFINNQTSANYTGPRAKDDVILVEVTPNDGTADGPPDTKSVTIQ